MKEFFISDEKDELIGNNKIEGYVNKIKDNYFFAGNIEIYITTKIFNLNIAVYQRSNTNEDFTQIALFTPGTSTKEYILINFENNIHYNLLIQKNSKENLNIYDKNKAAINIIDLNLIKLKKILFLNFIFNQIKLKTILFIYIWEIIKIIMKIYIDICYHTKKRNILQKIKKL